VMGARSHHQLFESHFRRLSYDLKTTFRDGIAVEVRLFA
jgi:hypothetical protein